MKNETKEKRKHRRKEYLYNYNCLTNFRIKHSSSDGHWEGFLPLRENTQQKTEKPKEIFIT